MALHNETGKRGEDLASEYFLNLGYTILHKNWRHRRWEIDLVVSKEGMLHIIEVKSRSSDRFGFPEENVSRKKLKNLIDAAAEFLYIYPEWKRVQFNVLAISFDPVKQPVFFLIEDVYL